MYIGNRDRFFNTNIFVLFLTALIVRFITKRFIGEYDPTLEKVYTFHTIVGNDVVNFEILDTAGQSHVRFPFYILTKYSFHDYVLFT